MQKKKWNVPSLLTAITLGHINSPSNSFVNLVQLSRLANKETGPQR